MDTLIETLKSVLEGYAGEALNGYSTLMTSGDGTGFTVISVGYVRGRRIVDAGLIVRAAAGKIIIERDINDKPLVEALLQTGVVRTQIVLAYAGEPVDDGVRSAQAVSVSEPENVR